MDREYDIIIIGGGPAGLTAGIYAARARRNTVLVERGFTGGQIVNAEKVENFPGFPEGVSGFDLGHLMYEQAINCGLNVETAEATGVKLNEKQRVVQTTAGDLVAPVVIVAGGAKRQTLGVPGEADFIGKGVSYCATCDAAFFRDQPVAVVGGGDDAISEALHLAKFASRVTVIHRRNQLRATRILQERAFSEPKIQFLWDTTVDIIEGEAFVTVLRLNSVPTGKKSNLEVSGIFVAIGFRPDTDYLHGVVPLDEAGQVITNERMETGVPGIFAAGAIRRSSGRQAITAAGDGATAAIFAERYLTEG